MELLPKQKHLKKKHLVRNYGTLFILFKVTNTMHCINKLVLYNLTKDDWFGIAFDAFGRTTTPKQTE